MERYFYRLGEHKQNEDYSQLIEQGHETDKEILKTLKNEGNVGLLGAIRNGISEEMHFMRKYRGAGEQTVKTWTPSNRFKEITKESYYSILKDETRIVSRHKKEGTDLKGWHYPTKTTTNNPELEIAKHFNIENVVTTNGLY